MNGIDFFKSCATNVRAVENVYELQYAIYTSKQGRNNDSTLEHATADLRARNMLCALVKEELYVFVLLDDISEVEDETQKYGLLNEAGPWADFEPTERNWYDCWLRDIFLDAIDGSIAYALAKEHNIMHIGHFSWLFPGSGKNNMDSRTDSVLIELDVNFTENGTLYTSTRMKHSRTQPLDRPENHVDAQILLAPSGRKAKLVTESLGDQVTLLKPTRSMHSDSTWTSKVSKAMLAEGLALDIDDEWLVLELVESGKHVRLLWPQRLCYFADKQSFSLDSATSTGQDWKHWFGGKDSPDAFKNPLAEAEEWLMGAAERERLTNAVNQFTASSSLSYPGNLVAETPLATSPPFNQRLMDQQAALSGIYPTPPDGLMPGHVPQQPTSDGNGAGMHAEHSVLSNELQLPSSDDNQMAGSSMESTGEVQAFQPNSDDLFGDMAEMEFGANEVGDADFDYFDEPDELPEATPADPDVEMEEAASTTQNKDDAEVESHDDAINESDLMATDELGVPDSRPSSSHDQTSEQVEMNQSHDQEVEAVASPRVSPSESLKHEPEKPLSPWGIRRQLLPMIPASAVSADTTQPQINRRNSTFEPIAFNENLDFVSKYAQNKHVDFATSITPNAKPSIALPQKKKKTSSKPAFDPDSGVTDLDSSSEYDSDESTSSRRNHEDLPPRLPWDTKKRKRSSWHEQATPLAGASGDSWPIEDARHASGTDLDAGTMSEVLGTLLNRNHSPTFDRTVPPSTIENKISALPTLPSLEDLFELSKLDLVYVAQIVGEQAVSSIPGILESLTDIIPPDNVGAIVSALESVMVSTAEKVLPGVDDCSISTLALMKDPPLQRPTMNTGKAPQTPQPRSLQREHSIQPVPDYFALPPPFIRMQRGTETWELSPPALNFWGALGLGPASGAKDVAPVVVMPGNVDLMGLVQDFVKELGGMYESRKLGSFMKTPEIDKALAGIDNYEDGCVIAGSDEESTSITTALKSFAEVCEDLGTTLAGAGHLDPDRTIVVLIIDPFEDAMLNPYLSACFWKLCQAYRQHIPKPHVRSARSDLALQILPVSLIASAERLVILDAQQVGCLATEIYDRCPPSSKVAMAMDTAAALPMLAAPAVELAPGPAKRPAFQLAPDPPNDLMNEFSVLNLAYSLSTDRQWMAACWIDVTGKYQMAASLSLRGKSFQGVAGEIWDRTLDIISARDVTWRIFIATESEMDKSEAKCWRTLAASRPRRQALHATLLSVQTNTTLQLTPPSPLDTANAPGNTSQFLTPGSTPQGAMTVSPDASGQAAPLTPAAMDATTSNPENDPDAHVIDTTDETWVVLLAPAFITNAEEATTNDLASKTAPPAMAHGMLFRRGGSQAHAPPTKLQGLGVKVHWDCRVRPNGAVEIGPPKQAEVTLREVLRYYRHLGLLGRARNLSVSQNMAGASPLLPVHVASAAKAAKALSWFRI